MPHIHELIDLTTNVLVVFKDKVLLRKHEKYNIWTGPGGHVELHEDPNQAAIRETFEEVGLSITLVHPDFEIYDLGNQKYKELVQPFSMNIHKINDTHQHLDCVYAAYCENDQVVLESDSDQVRWFTKQELLDFSEIGERQLQLALRALEIVKACI